MKEFVLVEWPESNNFDCDGHKVFDVLHSDAIKSPAIIVRKDLYEETISPKQPSAMQEVSVPALFST